MEPFDWPVFLINLSQLVLESDQRNINRYGFGQIPDEYHERGYMGYPGASEEQIAALEARLGADFLRKTHLCKARAEKRSILKPKGASLSPIRSVSIVSFRDMIRKNGLKLPASYRAFLKASNGWGHMGGASPGKLWSTDEIEWLWVRNQEDIDRWGNPEEDDASPIEHLQEQGRNATYYCHAYMTNCLEVSGWGDACILFLCPEVVTPDGEWECWLLASWHPGVSRDASFQKWFKECAEFMRLKDD